MATSCVCRGDLSSGLAKKERKKLHGLACEESRHVLEEEVYGSGLVETSLDSFICKNCDAKLQPLSQILQNTLVWKQHSLSAVLLLQ